MAEFTTKSQSLVKQEIQTFLKLFSNLTDTTPGSVLDTLATAISFVINDDYVAMIKIKQIWDVLTAQGSDLEAVCAKAGIGRKLPFGSFGYISFQDTSLPRAFLSADASVGDTKIFVNTLSQFPSAPPFTISIGQTDPAQEYVVSAVGAGDSSLTLAVGLASAAPKSTDLLSDINNLSSMVALTKINGVALNSTRQILPGALVKATIIGQSSKLDFITVNTGFIQNGMYLSTPILAKCTVGGSFTNVGPYSVTQNGGSAPFGGAVPVNLGFFTQGADLETDDELRERYLATIGGLSKGTRSAVKAELSTKMSELIKRISIIESDIEKKTYIYADIGESNAQVENNVQTALTVAVVPAGTVLTMASTAGMPEAFITQPQYFVLDPGLAVREIVTVIDINTTTSKATLNPGVVNAHAANTGEIFLLEVLTKSAKAGKRFYRVKNYPLVVGSFSLFVRGPAAGAAALLKVEGVDYVVNYGLGQIEFYSTKEPPVGSIVGCYYNYYLGAVATAQKLIDGDELNSQFYPGVRALGSKVEVHPAEYKFVDIVDHVLLDVGVSPTYTYPLIDSALIALIDKAGSVVYLSDLIVAAKSVQGVVDYDIISPVGDVEVPDGFVPKINTIKHT